MYLEENKNKKVKLRKLNIARNVILKEGLPSCYLHAFFLQHAEVLAKRNILSILKKNKNKYYISIQDQPLIEEYKSFVETNSLGKKENHISARSVLLKAKFTLHYINQFLEKESINLCQKGIIILDNKDKCHRYYCEKPTLLIQECDSYIKTKVKKPKIVNIKTKEKKYIFKKKAHKRLNTVRSVILNNFDAETYLRRFLNEKHKELVDRKLIKLRSEKSNCYLCIDELAVIEEYNKFIKELKAANVKKTRPIPFLSEKLNIAQNEVAKIFYKIKEQSINNGFIREDGKSLRKRYVVEYTEEFLTLAMKTQQYKNHVISNKYTSVYRLILNNFDVNEKSINAYIRRYKELLTKKGHLCSIKVNEREFFYSLNDEALIDFFKTKLENNYSYY